MSKKSRSRQNPQPQKSDCTERKPDSTNRHVYIDPSFKIDLAQDLKEQIESTHRENTSHSNSQLFWARLGTGSAIFAALLVAWQGLLLRQSNDINLQALVSVQRAFVSFQKIEGSRATNIETGLHSWYFYPVYENSGTTNAVNSITVFAIGAGGPEILEDEFIGKTHEDYLATMTNQTIGPKASFHGVKLDLEESFMFGVDMGSNFEKFKNIQPQKDLLFYGWLAYRDVFPQTKIHLTEFCQRLVDVQLSDNKSQTTVVVDFEACKHHNCSDEQCPDYNQVIEFARPRMK